MGGLGANIGGEEWEKARKKLEAAQEYAKSLRSGQTLPGAMASGNSSSFKRKDNTQKEKTARDKALEFAKNIPKPKLAKAASSDGQSVSGYSQGYQQQNQHDHGVIEEEPFDEYGNTLKGSEMNDLNARHDNLSNEVDRIKRSMFK